jgi:hypothetical protein
MGSIFVPKIRGPLVFRRLHNGKVLPESELSDLIRGESADQIPITLEECWHLPHGVYHVIQREQSVTIAESAHEERMGRI